MSALRPGQQLVGRGVGAVTVERAARGVWLMRGGFPERNMNVYLLEEEGGGTTVFDAGIRWMAPALGHVGRVMGGVNRVVLGHAHPDHRGAAPGLDAPVFCHPAEVRFAEGEGQPYADFSKLPVWNKRGPVRAAYPHLHRIWDGGPVRVAATVDEGDAVAGFEVVHLPGHAPGQIALWRERDRLVLASDAFYTLDPTTGDFGPPRVAHKAFNLDTEEARASMRKLAALEPRVAWAGHADPLVGDVRAQLEHAAGRPHG